MTAPRPLLVAACVAGLKQTVASQPGPWLIIPLGCELGPSDCSRSQNTLFCCQNMGGKPRHASSTVYRQFLKNLFKPKPTAEK